MIGRKNTRDGFTLVEILLVVAIIGVLATVFIFTMGGTPEKVKKDAAAALVQQVCGALDRYKLDLGDYPTDEVGGLDALVKKPSFTEEKQGEKWAGPYLKVDPTDPWGNKLGYEPTDAADEQAQTMPYSDDIRNKAWEQSEATE